MYNRWSFNEFVITPCPNLGFKYIDCLLVLVCVVEIIKKWKWNALFWFYLKVLAWFSFWCKEIKSAPKVWKPFKVVHCIEKLCLILFGKPLGACKCEAISKSNWAYNIIEFNDLRKNVHFGPHHFLPFSLLIYIWFSCLIVILCYSQSNINIIPLPCFDISYFHKIIIFNLEFMLGAYVYWCSNEGWWFHILLL